MPDGLGPVRNVGAGDALARTTALTVPAVVTRLPAVIVFGDDSGVKRPPVPTQALKASGGHAGRLPRRHRPGLPCLTRWVGRITGNPRDAHFTVVDLIEKRQILIGEWPVGSQPVLDPFAKVGRTEARPAAGIVDRRAADGVVHQWLHGVACDGVVLRQPAHVGIGAPAPTGPLDLPVARAMRIVCRPHPRTL